LTQYCTGHGASLQDGREKPLQGCFDIHADQKLRLGESFQDRHAVAVTMQTLTSADVAAQDLMIDEFPFILPYPHCLQSHWQSLPPLPPPL
jgi:hypothetical protein